jgi:hypothetical protein
VEQLPDGSILVSDDLASAIYRIRYVGPPEAPAEPANPAATEEAPG